MVGIIVVFPSKDNAANIRNLLVRNGMNVTGVCTSGAQALHYADTVDEGIVICGYKLKDMMYTELREFLPREFDILLLASPDKWSDGDAEGVMGLSMTLKAYDFINTMEMMLTNLKRRRKKKRETGKRDPAQQALIGKAKELLMERNHMSEEEAHRYIQKCSMDSGTDMTETAEMILRVMS